MLRAVDEEDRQSRRKSILEAARILFRQGDGSLPTAAEVAAAAGLAKGTVYLYFKTKDEIFANVLLEGWLALLASTDVISFGSNKKSRFQQAQVFIKAVVRRLEEEPDLMRLDALGAVLEKNMTPVALLEYKRRFNQGLFDAGSRIDRALGLASGRGLQLLMRTYALTRGLWQTAEHFEQCEAICINGGIQRPEIPFSKDLSEALNEYWRGALA
jgi:AcrR family transcriptional regulator